MALPATAALPSGERGPVEALALRRLASIFLRDDIGGFFRLYVSGLAVGNGPAVLERWE
jgi:hypothetical protein